MAWCILYPLLDCGSLMDILCVHFCPGPPWSHVQCVPTDQYSNNSVKAGIESPDFGTNVKTWWMDVQHLLHMLSFPTHICFFFWPSSASFCNEGQWTGLLPVDSVSLPKLTTKTIILTLRPLLYCIELVSTVMQFSTLSRSSADPKDMQMLFLEAHFL